jgi:hypothetical protein
MTAVPSEKWSTRAQTLEMVVVVLLLLILQRCSAMGCSDPPSPECRPRQVHVPTATEPAPLLANWWWPVRSLPPLQAAPSLGGRFTWHPKAAEEQQLQKVGVGRSGLGRQTAWRCTTCCGAAGRAPLIDFVAVQTRWDNQCREKSRHIHSRDGLAVDSGQAAALASLHKSPAHLICCICICAPLLQLCDPVAIALASSLRHTWQQRQLQDGAP